MRYFESHQLDFSLVERLIKQNQARFIGVIGSATKAKRFRMRLSHKQFSQHQIEQMTCPIGLESIQGKLPMEVAVSIAAQTMHLYQHNQPEEKQQPGLQWQQIKSQLKAERIYE
jgi:xanthine dehydrogenase accessory factor